MEHILKNTYWQSLLMVTFTIAQLQPVRLSFYTLYEAQLRKIFPPPPYNNS